jgi:hypothetical protein
VKLLPVTVPTRLAYVISSCHTPLVRPTISILNRVARRTRQSSQANAAAPTPGEPTKSQVQGSLSRAGRRWGDLATQTENIHRTLRGLLSSASAVYRHSSIRSGGLWTAAGPRFRTCV